MNLLYKSTRSADKTVTASEAILKGLADDGGLFVPEYIPKLDVTMDELKAMSYQETAYAVMKQFLTDFTEEELKHCISSAYDSKFDTEVIAPLVKVGDTYHLELFHGATIAFKDMALSILPHLLTTAARKNHVTNEIVILTATSGDTGKAALAGFADVPGTKIIVFYPKGGVSRVQELQMVTQKGDNTSVVAIHGNFDNAQSGVKAIFEDKELEKELETDNFTRLLNKTALESYGVRKMGELRPGERLYMLILDMDSFKRINDNFGHPCGDYVLRQVAGLMRDPAPKGARVGRLGGDEFGVLLATSRRKEEFLQYAQKLVEEVRDIRWQDLDVEARCSIGISSLGAGEGNWEKLYGDADRALYMAKRAGKDCMRELEAG